MKFFSCNIYKDGKPNYKDVRIERKKILKKLRSNQALKLKNSVLEFEKDFIELSDI